MVPIPRVTTHVTGVRLTTLDPILCGKDNAYSGCGFSFPACNASAKTIICGQIECLIHCHSIPHDIVSDQGISQPKKYDSGPMITEFTGIIMFPIIPK